MVVLASMNSSITSIVLNSFCTNADKRPAYDINFKKSKYSSYKYINDEHVFTVEQGTPFYLKLNLTANPMPKTDKSYRNGQELSYSPTGQIYIGMDYMRIDSVIPSQAGCYTISSSNFMGGGSLTFQLKVKCK